MNGPYSLNLQTISQFVPAYSLGTYILSKNGKVAHYVGRSDNDLANRLNQHASDYENYTHFWFETVGSKEAAFRLECQWWHKYMPDNNQNHPDRPDNSNLQCPVCIIFKSESW